MKEVFLRTEYNYDRDKASRESGLKCLDATLTQQQFKEETDINTIVERFHLTGELPQLQPADLPSYEHFEGIFDFQSAMNAVRAAQETFMELPADMRARFHNNPQDFHDFCINDKNHDEAERLGILSPEAVEKRAAARAAARQAEIDTAVKKKLDEQQAPPAPKPGTRGAKTDT